MNLLKCKTKCTYTLLGKNYYHPGYYICEHLKKNHKSIDDLAKEMKIDVTSLYKVCNGEKYMTFGVMLALAKATNIDVKFWQNAQDTYFHAIDCVSLY